MAEQNIYKLRQGNRDCAKYYAQFITHATFLEWDERTKISFFKRGLDEKPQKLLLTNVNTTETFTEYVSITIKLDNNLLPHKQQRYTIMRTNNGPLSRTTPSTVTGSHSGPMHLSATRCMKYQSKYTSRKREPISDNEKQRHRNNNLGMYCGNPGRWATDSLYKTNKTSN